MPPELTIDTRPASKPPGFRKSEAATPVAAAEATLLVTVLIDTYNYAQFLSRAIESALRQTYPESLMEILVIDDGSTDDSPAIAEQYAGRLTYLWKENGGQGSAYNAGFRRARGEIICLLDGDDYFYETKVACVVDTVRDCQEAGAIYNRVDIVDGEGNKLVAGYPKAILNGFIGDHLLLGYPRGSSIVSSGISLRRRLARQIAVPEEVFRVSADQFLTSTLPLIEQIRWIEEPLSAWVFHGSNQGLGSTPQMRDEHTTAIRSYADQNLGKHFIRYFGLSAFGKGDRAPAGFRDRLKLWQGEVAQIARAQVNVGIKALAFLKLSATLILSEQVYLLLGRFRRRAAHPFYRQASD